MITAEITVSSTDSIKYPCLGFTEEKKIVVQATEQELDDDSNVIEYRLVEECEESDDGAIRVEGACETSWVRVVANGWHADPEVDMVIIWGAGASTVDIVRVSDADTEYGRGVEECEAFLESVPRDDYWVVSVSPTDVTPGELDADPAVKGYKVVGP